MIRATFDRIGRHHDVPPLDMADGLTPDQIANQVHAYARKRLASRGVEVEVDDDAGTGVILAGFHIVGRFELDDGLMSICRDEDCPKCGYPETYAAGPHAVGPTEVGCRKCGWRENLP